ncbi:restriction endonuclease subunit S [Mesorhizobium sp. M1322]|uniref:restriction endonuclease subunit S n=1 Tax=Mesorhizobium sp. M1322 TaxID=2957081 RepID=UPI00333C4C0F
MVPEGWRTANARQICSKVTDGTHDTPIPVDSGVPYITAIHVKDGRIRFDDCLFLTEDDHREIYRRCNPQFGDLVVVNIGAGIGQCAAVNVTFEFSMKNVALLKPNPEQIDPGFFFQAFRSEESRIGHEARSGGAQPFISLRHLGQLRFLIPTMAEQKKIAEILSTWDAAIETTEELLANAEAQKRALMQQLLTGKRRLNGHVSNDWRDSLLVDAFDFINGRAFKPSDWGVSGLPIVRIQNLTKSSDTLNRFSGHVEDKHLVRYGDFLLSWSATLETFIWKDEDAVLNQHIFKVVPRADIDRNFGFYLISFEIDNLRSKVHGTSMKHITKKSLSKISARLPSYREQVAISAVLNSAANTEELYRRDLARLIREKRGLMQNLLTGKRRVTV